MAQDRLITVGTRDYTPDEVLSYARVQTRGEPRPEREYEEYKVWMDSQRYQLFKRSCVCVSCGLVGTVMLLQQNPGEERAHFNLYGRKGGTLVMFTKDHIVPKSQGGANNLNNYQTMCFPCNKKKAATPDPKAKGERRKTSK